MNLKFFKNKKRGVKGFVLPFTLLICSVILSVATSISVILVKELYFSKISRESQVAYYAADNGLMCAVDIDDTYINPETGLGIFVSSPTGTPSASDVLAIVNAERASRGLTAMNLYGSDGIKCASSEIFSPTENSFNDNQVFNRINSRGISESGRTSTFMMHMDLGDGIERCAQVTVNKTPNYRQIISQGYATCPGGFVAPIERAVVNETEVK